MATDEDASKELFRAVMRDDKAAIEEMERKGIDVLVMRNGANQSALQLASQRNKTAVKAYLQELQRMPAARRPAARASEAQAAAAAGGLPAGAAASPAAASHSSGGSPDASPMSPSDRNQAMKQLFRAVMQDDVKAVEAIVTGGLDVTSIKNAAGQRPVDVARERKRTKVMKYLISLDEQGGSPLAKGGSPSAKGGSPSAKDASPTATAVATAIQSSVPAPKPPVVQKPVEPAAPVAQVASASPTALSPTPAATAAPNAPSTTPSAMAPAASPASDRGTAREERNGATLNEAIVGGADQEFVDQLMAAADRVARAEEERLAAAAAVEQREEVRAGPDPEEEFLAELMNAAEQVARAEEERLEAEREAALKAEAVAQSSFTKGAQVQATQTEVEAFIAELLALAQADFAAHKASIKAAVANGGNVIKAAVVPRSSSKELAAEVAKNYPSNLRPMRNVAIDDLWKAVFDWIIGVINHQLAGHNDDVKKKIMALLPTNMFSSDTLGPADLSDGKILCALAISVQPSTIPRVDMFPLGRVSQFQQACVDLGLPKQELFAAADITPEPRNVDAVRRSLTSLARVLQAKPQWNGPKLAA